MTVGLLVRVAPWAAREYVLLTRADYQSYLATGTTEARQASWAFYRQALWLAHHKDNPLPRAVDPLSELMELATGIRPASSPASANSSSLVFAALLYTAVAAASLLWCRARMQPSYWDDLAQCGKLRECVIRATARAGWWLFAASACAAVAAGSVAAVVAVCAGGHALSAWLAVAGCCIMLLTLPLLAGRVRSSLKEEIASIIPVSQARCTRCSYLLAGVSGAVCPECGQVCSGRLFRPERTLSRLRAWAVAAVLSTALAVAFLQSAGARDWMLRFQPQAGAVLSSPLGAQHVLKLPMGSWTYIQTNSHPVDKWLIRVAPLQNESSRMLHTEWELFYAVAPSQVVDYGKSNLLRPLCSKDLGTSELVYVAGGRLDGPSAFGWLGVQPFFAWLDVQSQRSLEFVVVFLPGDIDITRVDVSSAADDRDCLSVVLAGLSHSDFETPTPGLDILASPRRYRDVLGARAQRTGPVE